MTSPSNRFYRGLYHSRDYPNPCISATRTTHVHQAISKESASFKLKSAGLVLTADPPLGPRPLYTSGIPSLSPLVLISSLQSIILLYSCPISFSPSLCFRNLSLSVWVFLFFYFIPVLFSPLSCLYFLFHFSFIILLLS